MISHSPKVLTKELDNPSITTHRDSYTTHELHGQSMKKGNLACQIIADTLDNINGNNSATCRSFTTASLPNTDAVDNSLSVNGNNLLSSVRNYGHLFGNCQRKYTRRDENIERSSTKFNYLQNNNYYQSRCYDSYASYVGGLSYSDENTQQTQTDLDTSDIQNSTKEPETDSCKRNDDNTMRDDDTVT